jgi:hypothetical protein
MTDEQLRTVEEFTNKYKLAPHDRPFASEAHDALAQLIKSGVNESEAKRLLRDAATAEDHRDYRRPEVGPSVGDALTRKELSISFLF